MPTVQSVDSLVFPGAPEDRSTLRAQRYPHFQAADDRPTRVADPSAPQITQLPSASPHNPTTTWGPARSEGIDELPMSFATDATDATWPAPQVPKEVVVQRIAQEATLVLPRAPEIDTEPEPPTELLRAPTELLRAPTELLRAPTELLQAPTRHLPVPDARRRSRRRGADPADIAVTSSLAGLAVVIFVTMTVGGFLILWQVVL